MLHLPTEVGVTEKPQYRFPSPVTPALAGKRIPTKVGVTPLL